MCCSAAAQLWGIPGGWREEGGRDARGSPMRSAESGGCGGFIGLFREQAFLHRSAARDSPTTLPLHRESPAITAPARSLAASASASSSASSPPPRSPPPRPSSQRLLPSPYPARPLLPPPPPPPPLLPRRYPVPLLLNNSASLALRTTPPPYSAPPFTVRFPLQRSAPRV